MIQVVSHLLVAYVVLVEPWLGNRLYQKLKAQVAAGRADAKVRFYRTIFVHQVAAIVLVLMIAQFGSIPREDLGLSLPTSWQRVGPILAGFLPATIVAVVLLRKKGEGLLKATFKMVGAMLPFTSAERSWFAGISVGAGVSEELVFRGFLLYYITVNLPVLGVVERVVLASAVFGLCHFYQGWQGVLGTAVLGAVFAGLYVETGSLLLPVILHALIDLRILLIVTPKRLQALQAENTTQVSPPITL
jgi:membrane protease YdiL (CAAX protease family)